MVLCLLEGCRQEYLAVTVRDFDPHLPCFLLVPNFSSGSRWQWNTRTFCCRSQIFHRVSTASERRSDHPGELPQPEHSGYHPSSSECARQPVLMGWHCIKGLKSNTLLLFSSMFNIPLTILALPSNDSETFSRGISFVLGNWTNLCNFSPLRINFKWYWVHKAKRNYIIYFPNCLILEFPVGLAWRIGSVRFKCRSKSQLSDF